MMKTLLLLSGLIMLSACSNMSGALGVPVGQETREYKVEGAGGVIAEVKKGDAAQSNYRYGFTILLKQAEKVRSVKIERISNGQAEIVLDDSLKGTEKGSWQAQQPLGARSYLHGSGVGSTTWVGQTAPRNLTQTQAPWLYQTGNTKQHYRITITDVQGRQTILQQPTFIPANLKNIYLQLINSK